jgi:uncharacterized protein (TIGR02118 family)
MFLVNIMYPKSDGSTFDMDYYLKTHITMAEAAMKPFGLVKWAVQKGVPAADGTPSPYMAIGQLFFKTREGYAQSINAHGAELRADFPNYTNVQPVRQFSELAGESR